jgi:hypothetical protein
MRHRSSRIAASPLKLLGAAAAINFLRSFLFSSCFLPTGKFEAGRWLFLIGPAVPEGRASRTTQAATQSEARNFVFAQEKILLNPPLGAAFVLNSELHTGARPSVLLRVGPISARRTRKLQSKQFALGFDPLKLPPVLKMVRWELASG